MRAKRWAMAALLTLAAGCTRHDRAGPVTALPASTAPAEAAALPPGASPGMLVPAPLADGSFPTPNRALSAAATIWHLRAALNVAALSCGGTAGEAIRTGYNEWLRRDRAPLAAAATGYAGEYRGAGASAFDDAMTRLYNFWSQTPVRPAFCAAAASAMASVAASDPDRLATLAPPALASLDRPFVDFYRAYDAWRRASAATGAAPTVIAAAAPVAPAPADRPRAVAVAARPRLVLDLSSLPVDAEVASPLSAR